MAFLLLYRLSKELLEPIFDYSAADSSDKTITRTLQYGNSPATCSW